MPIKTDTLPLSHAATQYNPAPRLPHRLHCIETTKFNPMNTESMVDNSNSDTRSRLRRWGLTIWPTG